MFLLDFASFCVLCKCFIHVFERNCENLSGKPLFHFKKSSLFWKNWNLVNTKISQSGPFTLLHFLLTSIECSYSTPLTNSSGSTWNNKSLRRFVYTFLPKIQVLCFCSFLILNEKPICVGILKRTTEGGHYSGWKSVFISKLFTYHSFK